VARQFSTGTASKPAEKNRAKPEKQKGKKEGGLGEGIFALLRIKIERSRFSLNKRNTKQKNFLFLLKEKIAREKIKKCRENFSVLICPAPHLRGGAKCLPQNFSAIRWENKNPFSSKNNEFVSSNLAPLAGRC